MSAERAQAQVDYYRPNPHKHTTLCRRCRRRLESLLALYGIENRETAPLRGAGETWSRDTSLPS